MIKYLNITIQLTIMKPHLYIKKNIVKLLNEIENVRNILSSFKREEKELINFDSIF